MSILRYEPWNLNAGWPSDVFRLFDSVSNTNDGASTTQWQPRVDILEFDEHYDIRADLPGVNPDNVDITLEGKQLTIAGSRASSDDAMDAKQHRLERQVGEFARHFVLPDSTDRDNIQARSEHGVLHVIIPKRKQSEARKIAIQH